MAFSSDQSITNIENSGPIKITRLNCEFTLMESLGMIILWLIIIVLTLGLGAFVMPYYFYKAVINKTWIVIHNGEKTHRLNCELNIAEMVGHIILWIVLSIVTLGIALIFYYFRTLRLCMNKTVIQRA